MTASASYTVTVTDSATPAHSATASFTLVVDPAALVASTAVANRTEEVGKVVNYTPVTATGGAGALSYTVSPTLPNGLSMSSATGAITGTPNAVTASANYTVTVSDRATPAHTATASFTLSVNTALTAIQRGIGGKGQDIALRVGDNATFPVADVSGGAGALTYSVSPTLPESFTVANGYVGTKTATAAAVRTKYTMTTSDSGSPVRTVTSIFFLTVHPDLTVSTTVANHTATAGQAVNYTPVTANGGFGNYTYTVSPALPTGLSISSTTGLITGTASAAAASANYTVKVVDRDSTSFQSPISRTATFELTVDPSPLKAALTNSSYIGLYIYVNESVNFHPVAATGGVAPYTYSISPTLPLGLSMSPTTGYITGSTLSTGELITYTVTVKDSAGHSATAETGMQVMVSPDQPSEPDPGPSPGSGDDIYQ